MLFACSRRVFAVVQIPTPVFVVRVRGVFQSWHSIAAGQEPASEMEHGHCYDGAMPRSAWPQRCAPGQIRKHTHILNAFLGLFLQGTNRVSLLLRTVTGPVPDVVMPLGSFLSSVRLRASHPREARTLGAMPPSHRAPYVIPSILQIICFGYKSGVPRARWATCSHPATCVVRLVVSYVL